MYTELYMTLLTTKLNSTFFKSHLNRKITVYKKLSATTRQLASCAAHKFQLQTAKASYATTKNLAFVLSPYTRFGACQSKRLITDSGAPHVMPMLYTQILWKIWCLKINNIQFCIVLVPLSNTDSTKAYDHNLSTRQCCKARPSYNEIKHYKLITKVRQGKKQDNLLTTNTRKIWQSTNETSRLGKNKRCSVLKNDKHDKICAFKNI